MAVKTYSLKTDGDKYCSAHTKVREMRCKDGSDKILIDTELMEMIEKLFAKLQCSKYIISSGYRTPDYSGKVGGFSTDQHTKGKAVDACFYDKNGKIISAKIVCCVAQDVGFKGIANISSKYQYVHLDMRDSGTYKGDEIKSYKTVTADFYGYFHITPEEVKKYTGEKVIAVDNHFKKYMGDSSSIVDGLKAIGASSTFAYRSKIAKANGIKAYIGTASQNSNLLKLLKQGKLIKP